MLIRADTNYLNMQRLLTRIIKSLSILIEQTKKNYIKRYAGQLEGIRRELIVQNFCCLSLSLSVAVTSDDVNN